MRVMKIPEFVDTDIDPSELVTDLANHRRVLRVMLVTALREYVAYLMKESDGPQLLDVV